MDTNHSPIISPLTMRESARGITLTSICLLYTSDAADEL